MEINVETAVTQVTVYPDRARVTAVAECECEPGLHRLLVAELPLTMETDSVRVTGQGTAHVRILSVDVMRRFYEQTPAARLRDLLREIEQVEAEISEINDGKEGWLAHGRYLDGLRQATEEYAKGLARGKTTVADQTTLIAFLQEQDSQMRTAVRGLDQQLKETTRRLQKLQQEAKQLGSVRPKERNQVQIEVEVLTAGTFRPQVSYVVNKAGWQPLYDVRLLENGSSQSLAVSYIAQVTQNSGQDWQGVALSVSTARPSLNQRLPELHPWFVDEARPVMVRSMRKPTAQPMAAAAPADMRFSMEAAEAEEGLPVMDAEVASANVQANESGTAVTFNIPGGTDIPSDGSPHKTTLQQFNLEPQLDYLCIPKHTDSVYRRATVRNSSPSPLLAGSASLFVGDEFIGRTQVSYTAVDGEIELLLGVEEGITIEREMTKRDVDKKMLRDQRRIRFGYEIKLKNLRKHPVQVEVQDHIPVSRNENIKIKLDQVKPVPAEQSDLNLLEWQLTLAPDSEQTILYEFLVEYPQAMNIIGISD